MTTAHDPQVVAAINELPRSTAIDILDDCFGVGIRDEQGDESLQAEVLRAYLAGKLSSADILAYT